MGLEHWIAKATFDSATDLASKGQLSPAQARKFIRVMVKESVMMKENRIETHDAPKFEIPRIAFANRLLKVGTQGARLDDADRIEPAAALVTIDTNLFKGETLVADEALEDSVERAGLADTFMTMIAEACGRDVEEYGLLNNDTRATSDTGYAAELDVFSGLVEQAVGDHDGATTGMVTPAGQNIADASSYTTFDSLFAAMIEKLPAQYRRDIANMRFYTSVVKADRYAESLAERGTPLGDKALTDGTAIKYRGIPVVGVPMLTGTYQINANAMVYDNVVILTHRLNVVWGFCRKIRLEKWRDPRAGATSFLSSVRFDAKFADPNYIVSAKKATAL